VTAPSRPRRPVVHATPRLQARAQAERAARRRQQATRAGLGLAVVVPVVLLGWLLLSSPLLAVRTVTVSGTERLTADHVRAVADVRVGTPLARVDTGAVVRRVRALPVVAQVSVSRGWPGTLRVRVVERTAVAALVDARGAKLVDGSGVPFATVAGVPAGTVRLQVPHPGPKDATTRSALQVLEDLPASLRSRLRTVQADSPASVTLVLRDGRQVLWGGSGDTGLKARATEVLLKMPGTVFDVSRPGVVTRR
jgi:cell division protein FtsQ